MNISNAKILTIEKQDRDSFLHDLLFTIWDKSQYGDPTYEDILCDLFYVDRFLCSPIDNILTTMEEINVCPRFLFKAKWQRDVFDNFMQDKVLYSDIYRETFVYLPLYIAFLIMDELYLYYKPRKYYNEFVPNKTSFKSLRKKYDTISRVVLYFICDLYIEDKAIMGMKLRKLVSSVCKIEMLKA